MKKDQGGVSTTPASHGRGFFFGAPGMARSARRALFPRVVPRNDLGVKVPYGP